VGIETGAAGVSEAADIVRNSGRNEMSKTRKYLAAAFAGAALLGASPAAARTVVMFFAPSHLMVGYIVYGDDGHICEQYGGISNTTSTWHVDGDC
jgi:hypothetical protein